MDTSKDQYVIDFEKDVAFLLVYKNVAVLDTVYVFKDQLHLAKDPVWRRESIVYMSVHQPYKSQDYTKINGFHWLSAHNMSRIDYIDGAVCVQVIDYAFKRNRLDFWDRKWSSWNYRKMEDQMFIEAANNSINYDGYCECKRGLTNKKDDHFYGLDLPWNPGAWNVRSGADKYSRLFADCFSKSGVGDASKAEVL